MKPANFPDRKYLRQCRAQHKTADKQTLIDLMSIRTKKNNAGKARLFKK